MGETWLSAFIWIGLALLASVISMRAALSVSLVEIILGVAAGNFLHLDPNLPWVSFLASLGSLLLAFLAGAEIDPQVLRKYRKESALIGLASFLAPFLGCMALARFGLGWDPDAAKVAGLVLSETSIAVVYTVIVQTRLNRTELGTIVLAACFVTGLGMFVALGVMFADHTAWLFAFLAATAAVLALAPRGGRWFFARFGSHVSEPETKLLLVLMFGLGWLATKAGTEAVLPAYLLGLAVSGIFKENREMPRRLRTAAFALLTPFFFLKAGMLVSLPAAREGLALILAFLAAKVGAKCLGVFPACAAFRFRVRTNVFTTLLMSTGLTLGNISALFGYGRGLITREQYTVLVIAMIGSAVLPTLIAQWFFRPGPEAAEGGWRRGAAPEKEVS